MEEYLQDLYKRRSDVDARINELRIERIGCRGSEVRDSNKDILELNKLKEKLTEEIEKHELLT
jgi:hypothetical protein